MNAAAASPSDEPFPGTASPRDTTRIPRLLRSLLCAYGALVLVALLLTPLHFLPAEDVVILHGYSRNLAQHGAITYYAGGPHAEGATDFGWMLLLAGAMRCGLSPNWVTAAVNVVSLVGLGLVLCRLARLRGTLLHVLPLCAMAGLLPQIVAAAAGFPVLPFALLLTALVQAGLSEDPRLAPLLALALSLFRPDGVIFAGPLLLTGLFQSRRRGRDALWIGVLFLLPGALYFVWRTEYFHQLLPLPFLVKADAHRILGLVVAHSFQQSLKYLASLGAVLFVLRPVRLAADRLLVCLVCVPTLFFWAMRLDQNVGDRFFFYLPLATAILVAVRWPQLGRTQRVSVAVAAGVAYLVLLLGPFLREVRTFRDYQFRDVEQIATSLGALPVRGTLLTTEAGFLAYGSQWISDDAWGLDTPAFAKHLIQPTDVAKIHPDLVVVHPAKARGCKAAPLSNPGTIRDWNTMVDHLLQGAHQEGDFQLWQLSYGSDFYRRRNGWSYGQGDPECFLVRQSSPLHEAITAILQQHHAVPESTE